MRGPGLASSATGDDPDKDTVDAQAIDRAASFLLAHQDDDGYWRDYALLPGASTQWITAVVGDTLGRLPSTPLRRAAVERALDALRAGCRPAGWGYNERVAPDADSTAWAVRCFARAGSVPPIEPCAALRTYLSVDGGARTFTRSPRYGRWTEEHADVTAVLGLALREADAEEETVAFVRRWALAHRDRAGLWRSFWWSYDAYVVAHQLELLAATGGVPSDVAAAAARWLEGHAPAITAMEAAHLLASAIRCGAPRLRWYAAVLAGQQGDGGWQASPVLRVPAQRGAPGAAIDAGELGVFADERRVMSTAMSIAALFAAVRGSHGD